MGAPTYAGGFASAGYICDKICPTLMKQGGYMRDYVKIFSKSIETDEITEDPEAVVDELVEAPGDTVFGEIELVEFGTEVMATTAPK